MISLFLDSSDKRIIISILKDLEIIKEIIEDNDNNLSKRFLPLIDSALTDTDLTLQDINKIFIVTGPGSFTGVRIGVDIAKVMAYSLNIEIIPISELELLSTTDTKKDFVVSYIDARRGYVYAGMYDNNLNSILKDEYISLEKLNNKIRRHTSFDRVSYVSYYDNIEGTSFPKIDVTKIVKKHIEDKSINPHEIVPNYLKRTEAEENLIKNGKRC